MKWITALALLLLATSPVLAETCLASVYGTKDSEQNGTTTASGIPLRDDRVSIAHKTLPLRTKAKIVDKRTGRAIIALVTDRGPFKPGRCVDLSHQAALGLGVGINSLTLVKVEGEN